MANIYGLLGLNDGQRVMLSSIGQSAVYGAVQQYLAAYNAEIQTAMNIFVDENTSDYKRRYVLPGGGMLQRRGGQTQSAAVKASCAWDVAFPLEEYGAQVAATLVDYAYMSSQDLARHLDSVRIQDLNTVRFAMLQALLNSSARTWTDPLWGSLTIQPLANGDSVTYPPVLGSQSEATENHYIGSNYAASSISDSNDPIVTIVDELQEHFGAPTGGGNIAVFVNNAQRAKLAALTEFIDLPDNFVRVGANTATPETVPANLPGRIIGRHNAGAWVVEWRQMPAAYMLGLDLDAPAPLVVREDPADTGLPRGLTLVSDNSVYPFTQSHYSHRFGVGVGNRLNGVAVQLVASTSYSTPSGF